MSGFDLLFSVDCFFNDRQGKLTLSCTQLSNPFISGGGLKSATVLFCVTLWNHMEAISREQYKKSNVLKSIVKIFSA